MTRLVERGHNLGFIKGLDLTSFQSLVESSERVWRMNVKFQTKQNMIAAQGTAKAIEGFFKELTPREEIVQSDTKKFKAKFGA